MANMFLSKLKAAAGAILQASKTVTATTTTQTVQPDSGYDAMEEVVVNPQVHSSTKSYTSNGTKDLGQNHNYRYVSISVPTPTPSVSTQGIASTGTVSISCSVGDLIIVENASVSGATLLANYTGTGSSYVGLYRCTSTTVTLTNMYTYKFGLIKIHF